MTKSRGILGPRKPWKAVDDARLRRLWPKHPTHQVATLLGRTACTVDRRARKLKLTKDPAYLASPASGRIMPGNCAKGAAGRFKPGSVPPNKGRRTPGFAPGRMAATQFKRGGKPYNAVAIGSTRVNSLGVADRKVADFGRTNLDWEAEHRLVWFAHHGPIPSGHVVAFKPGRATAEIDLITIDALELLSRADVARRNRMDARYPPEICKAIRTRAALVRAINRSERNGQ